MQLKQFSWENRIVQYVLLALLMIYLFARALKGGDFDVYLFEAKKLLHGLNIYKAPYYNNMPYTYSVFWALFLIPFTFMPKLATEYAWLMLNVFFLYRICVLIVKWLDLHQINKQNVFYIFLIGFGLTIRFLLYNFSMIQMTIFLMYACMEGLDLITKNKKLAGSLLLGVAMNIKLLPLVFIPYLIYRGEFKAFFYVAVVFLALIFIPGLFIGITFNNLLLQDWWASINPASQGRMLGETMSGTIGLNSLVPVLLMDTTGELPYKRNFVNLSSETVGCILTLLRITLVLVTLYFLRFPPFRKVKDTIHQMWEICYLLVIMPLLAPQQQKYAFFFVFPALVYIVYFLYMNWNKLKSFRNQRLNIVLGLLFIFFCLTTLTSDGIVGRKLNLVFQHYRTITYAGIVLVVMLTLCRPSLIPRVEADLPPPLV